MKYEIQYNNHNLRPYAIKLIREEDDGRISNESHLLHRLKKELIFDRMAGGDWIKKRMWKDGNLVSDHCQYVRMRKAVEGNLWAIWDSQYAVRDAAEDYRKAGWVTLNMINLEGEA